MMESRAPAETSKKAIVGFVLSLVPCMFLAIPGLILSIIARGEIKRSNGSLSGGGLALAGIIMAGVWMSVGVLGIFAAIAIPNFIKFQARAKQAEAKAAMKVLPRVVQDYKDAHGGRMPASFEDLGWKPDSQRYTFYLGDNKVSPTQAEVSAIPRDVDVSSAVVVAVGNVDNDPTLDVWTLDSEGAVRHVMDDVNDSPGHENN